MKSQTDMIVSIVAVLLALIMAGVFYGTARQPAVVTPPEQVRLGAPQYPTGAVTYADSLPGAGGARGGGMGSMGGMGAGGGKANAIGGGAGGNIGQPQAAGLQGASGGGGKATTSQ